MRRAKSFSRPRSTSPNPAILRWFIIIFKSSQNICTLLPLSHTHTHTYNFHHQSILTPTTMPTMSPAGQFHLEDLLSGVQSASSSVTSRSSRQPTLRFILTSPPSCSPSSSQSQLCHYIGNFSLLVNAAQFPAILRRVPRKCFPRRPFTKPATSPLPSTTAPTTSATTMASTSLPRTTAATSASWTQALTSYSIGGKPRVTSSTESTIRRADVSFRSLQVRFRTS